MIGLKLLLAGVNRTGDLQRARVVWWGDALPTCELTLDNQHGAYSALPLFSSAALTLPNGVGTFNFYTERQVYKSSRAEGHTVDVYATAAPELINLTEGNLDVVGTDLPVGEFAARGTSYVPYVSTYVPGLGSPLMDVGNVLTALLHTAQPNQAAGYRGRLGYDCTGLGVSSSAGADYVSGPLSFYVKGMWQVGLGATGAQRTGIDLIKELLTKNLVDGSGNPIFADWYVDHRTAPPTVSAFNRGTVDSTATFTVGKDAIEELELPVDVLDVESFVVAWFNAESAYPNGGDAWSNYDTAGSRLGQWTDATNSGAGTVSVSADVPFAAGTSFKYTNSSTVAYWDVSSSFQPAVSGYAMLNSAPQGTRNLSAFNLYGKVDQATTTDNLIQVTLDDGAGNTVVTTAAKSAEPQGWTAGTWNLFTVAIPASGAPPAGGPFIAGAGSWVWGSNKIAKVTVEPRVAATSPAQSILIDRVGFSDNWGFSPDYSYNTLGASATTLTATASAGQPVLVVQSSAGYVAGQYCVIGVTAAGQETLKILSVAAQAITLSTNLLNTHASGQIVTAATHDPNSMAAYGPRIFNFCDFYVSSGQSDAAPSVADGIVQSRKGKKSTGTLKVSGYAPQVPLITPRSILRVVSPKDVYKGGSADSAITGWIADEVDYSLSTGANEGFTAAYRLEPFYATFAAASPDTNRRNLWRQTEAAGFISRLSRAAQYFGGQR